MAIGATSSPSSPDGPPIKVRDVLALLRRDGWRLVVQHGSHRQLKHDTKRARVTVAGHDGDDLAIGTLKSIMKQAGLEDPR